MTRFGVVFMLGIAICSTFASVTLALPGDTTPPVISNVTVFFNSSLVIAWETHEISDSVVQCGMESGHYTIEKVDRNYVLFHSIRLEDIKEDGTYYFVLMSTDPGGNVAQTPEHKFFLTTTPRLLNPGLIEPFFLMLSLVVILGAIPVVIISVVIYKNKKRAEELKQKTDELKQRVEEFKKIKARVLPKSGFDEVEEIRGQVLKKQGVDDGEVKAQVVAPQGQAADELKEIKAEAVPTLEPGLEELKEIKAEVALTPEPGLEELKEIKAEAIPKPVQPADELKEIKAEVVSGVKAGEEKERETALSLSIDRIRDVLREKRDMLTIKYIGNPKSPSQGQRLASEQLFTTHLSADEHVLDEVERKLVLSLAASTFNVYFLPSNESLGKGIEPEKGLLKMTTKALWIIGREGLKRIAGEDIVHVEQMRRSIYQGADYGALSIEYLDEGSTSTGVLSTIVITKGNTTEVLLKHVQELADAYKLKENLSEAENQILSMMHAGALDLSLSKLASTAQALKLSEEELMNHLERLSKLDVIDLANQTLRKKGIKYLFSLSKQAFGG